MVFLRKITAIFISLFLASTSFAGWPPLFIEEQDGSPTGVAYKLKVSNGTLTKDGVTFTMDNVTVGSPVASGTNDSVLYIDSSGNLANSNPGFTFDGTHLSLGADNAELRLGATPSTDFSLKFDGSVPVFGAGNAAGRFTFQNTDADSANKQVSYSMPAWDTDQIPLTFFLGAAQETDNFLIFGGGSGSGQAATSVGFYTAVATGTAIGTERVMISSAGFVGIGVTDPDEKLEILNAGTQLKLSNNSANYFTFATQADGDLTLDSNKTSYDLDFGDGDLTTTGNIIIDSDVSSLFLGDTISNFAVGFNGTNPRFLTTATGGRFLFENAISDSTTKQASFAIEAWDTDQNPFTYFVGAAQAANNLVIFGGGSGSGQAATIVQFYTAPAVNTAVGTARLTITGDGDVGIGTDAPDEKLQVLGNMVIGDAGTAFSAELLISGGNNGLGTATIEMGTITREWQVVVSSSPYDWHLDYVGTDAPLGSIIHAERGGNVGIGQPLPSEKLEVSGNILTTTDSDKYYSGAGKDSYVEFDGDSMNIVANAVTGTGALEFTAGSYEFNVPADTDIQTEYIGTTHSGMITWMEDEDYFKFHDDIIVDETIIYTPSATTNILAAGGITATKTIMRVQGDGGAIDITANPQIVAGLDGQLVCIQGDDDVNTVTLDDGTGLQLAGAASFVLGQGDIIQLIYDSGDTNWIEVSRSNN